MIGEMSSRAGSCRYQTGVSRDEEQRPAGFL